MFSFKTDNNQINSYLKLNFFLLFLALIITLSILSFGPSYLYGALFGIASVLIYLKLLVSPIKKNTKNNKKKRFGGLYFWIRILIFNFCFIIPLIFVNQLGYHVYGIDSMFYPVNIFVTIGIQTIPTFTSIISLIWNKINS